MTTEEAHLQRLRDLAARMDICQTPEAEEAIQRLIDAENERYAKQ